uniref:Uncharacterized protein n=1 Tax=Strongyloides papillosus TaxID=174720 RepID=A0A0N5BJK1_STREA
MDHIDALIALEKRKGCDMDDFEQAVDEMLGSQMSMNLQYHGIYNRLNDDIEFKEKVKKRCHDMEILIKRAEEIEKKLRDLGIQDVLCHQPWHHSQEKLPDEAKQVDDSIIPVVPKIKNLFLFKEEQEEQEDQEK